jgi:type II secretory pathway predicted ATPase ExeA
VTTVFLDFYRLREQPFGVSPDPRYLYFSPGHREALASLFYGIETGGGFLALIAEPGMGKTSLLLQLLERLKGSIRSAFLFQTQCDSRELLRYLLGALGIDSLGNDIVQSHARLIQFLLGEASAGRRVVVFIDEAQNLTDETLETVRLLSNFEVSNRKLIQIVLSGQLELARRLKNPLLGQLSQRITVLTGLKRFGPTETFSYIRHRLDIAGYEGPEIFASSAIHLIAQRSQGIPRNINRICFNALSLGYALGCKRIGKKIVQEALNDLSLDNVGGKTRSGELPSSGIAGRPALSLDEVGGRVFENRTLQTAVLFALLGSLATYFVAYRGAAVVRSSPGMNVPVDSAVRMPAAFASPEPANPDAHQTTEKTRFITYIVQPHDNISNLCEWSIGHYDEAALAELRKLNPDLINADHIEVGDRLRLPVRHSN